MKKLLIAGLLAATGCAIALPLAAQQAAPTAPAAAAPAPAAAAAAGRGGRNGGGAANATPAPPPAIGSLASAPTGGAPGRGFLREVVDPEAVQLGKLLFTDKGCTSCHAIDMRGVDGKGPNLLPTSSVLEDRGDNLLPAAIRNSPAHAGRGYDMLTTVEVHNLDQFMKGQQVAGYDTVQMPVSFQVGDAAAGQTYFAAHCASCHAVTAGATSPAANLAGVATRISDPHRLQQAWLSPSTTKPTMVTITPAKGAPISGKLVSIDEFSVVLTDAGNIQRTVPRNGDDPKVVVDRPLAPHNALLRVMSDDDIHNVTGYLVTLK